MSLKWIGAILVIAGCGGMGFLMAWNYSREIAALRQLATALEFMCCELEYNLTPLSELCSRAAGQLKGSMKAFFLSLGKELESQIAPDAAFCVTAALRSTSGIPSRAVRILETLGGNFGRFDLTGQIKGLQAALAACQLELNEMERNRPQRTRSYQTLGLCAGAALAILFM